MQTGVHPHQTLQPEQIVRRLHHILAVVQGQFVLTRRKFGNQRLGLNARRLGPCIDVVEQRQHPVQLIDRIDIGLAVDPPVQHVARGHHLAIRAQLVVQQEELQLERARGVQPLGGQRINLPLQGVARVRGHRAAVQFIDAHQHLTARRVGAVQGGQRAGNGPAATVAVTLIPDQTGLVDILAADIQTQDRHRQMAATLVNGQQLMAADDLAPANAVRNRARRCQRPRSRDGRQGRLRLRQRRNRRGWSVSSKGGSRGQVRRKVRSALRQRRRSGGQPVSWRWRG